MILPRTKRSTCSKVPSMDSSTAHKLNSINGRFYDQCAQSFSATRHNSWAGWEQALKVAGIETAPSRVLDVACGNLRYEEFLAQRWPAEKMTATCIDGSLPLMDAQWLGKHPNLRVITAQEDIIARLIEGEPALQAAENDYDLIACMGFMHHVPGFEARAALLRRMAELLAPGGALVVSFWQFLTSKSIAQQAQNLTLPTCEENDIDPLQLEEGDCFLGWQNFPNARRYCHSFTEEEVMRLAAAAFPTGEFELSSFESDGRNSRMNRYLIAKKS